MSGSSREEGRIARDGAKEQGGPLEHVLAFAAGGRVEAGRELGG